MKHLLRELLITGTKDSSLEDLLLLNVIFYETLRNGRINRSHHGIAKSTYFGHWNINNFLCDLLDGRKIYCR
jgi:hypothetical protein